MSLGEESAQDTLGVLQSKGDKFTKLSIIERKRYTDLEDAIAYVSAETDKFRRMAKKAAIEVMNVHVLTPNPAYSRADGVNIAKEAHTVTRKTLNVLEAKINKLLQRKSEIENKNRKIKTDIDHYRLLRLQTDVAHAKFETVLTETKERIESLLGESTKVVEDRERQLEKKDALERLNSEEQEKFTLEYEAMGRYIKAQNVALEESLLKERKHDQKQGGVSLAKSTGGAGNSNTQNTADSADFGNSGPQNTASSTAVGGVPTSDLTLEEEIAMAKKVGTLTTFMAAEQSSLSDLRRKIGTYETMFDQLKSMTGVESLEEMVSNYISHEEEMFSLYNFIQTINTEIDTTVEATAQTEAEIAKYKDDQQDQDQQRRSTIDELQQRLASTLEVTRQLDAQNTSHQESVSQIGKKVYTLFFKLQCDQMDTKGSQVTAGKNQKWSSGARPESKIALLTSQGVSESNVVDYLGCIEQRAVDIISEYLRVINAQNAATGASNKFGTMPRSPTPGPSTPMTWRMGGKTNYSIPYVDLADISDDEFMNDAPLADDKPIAGGSAGAGAGAGGMTPANVEDGGISLPAAVGTNNPNASMLDSDNKPVDLSTFKNKLQRKLGLSVADSKSGTAVFRGGNSSHK
mmetsp:Transcript_21773/g.36408  ORF Transcript_21773/g.36408 Transcript_21773/m.36408 type:complete len:631 (+) Transcript_21773:133-2025(+)